MLGLLLALLLVHAGCARASCSPMLGYLQKDDRWEALLSVAVPESLLSGEDLVVNVTMVVIQHEGLEASLEVSENAAVAGGRILYRVRFPVPNSAPLPRITAVVVNGEPLCQENTGTAMDDQEILLSHKLKIRQENATSLPINAGASLNTTYRSSATNQRVLLNADECGIKRANNQCGEDGAVLVHSEPEDWPWLVVVLHTHSESSVLAVGSLVTAQHVITAAKTLYSVNSCNLCLARQKFVAESILVNIAATNLKISAGSEQNLKVKAIIHHPEFVVEVAHEHNLAILVLATPLALNPATRPVCAWTSPQTVATHGYAVGLNTLTKTAYMQSVPIVSLQECRENEIYFKQSFRAKSSMICAGWRNGVGMCSQGHRGLSGSGLYVPEVTSDGHTRWSLKGVWNMQLNMNGYATCNLTAFVSYTDVSKATAWIDSVIFPPSECGESANVDKPLVYKGTVTHRGDWPWLAALYVKNVLGVNYECAGTLISTRHVVTAAHCVSKQKKKITHKADKIIVGLGKYDLNDFAETGMQLKEVKEIIVHPNFFVAQKNGKVDSDLAVLVLATAADFSATVRPICLWNEAAQLADNRGTVVGWGADEEGRILTDEPRLVRMPLVTKDNCITSHQDLARFVTENTLCAGSRDGSGPCNGDSGSGVYMPVTSAGGRITWQLRGLVSRSLKNETTRICVLSEYVVLTDLNKFTSWLRNIMSNV